MNFREAKSLILTFFIILSISTFAGRPSLAVLPVSVQEEEVELWKEKVVFSLDSLLSDSLLQTSQLGLCIYDLTADRLLFQYNSEQRMRPASCQKIVTAVSALQLLGADHKMRTRVMTTGSVADGTLSGDLFVVGSMDPLLSKADLKALAQQLRESGVKNIGGRMFVDVSMKDSEPLGWGWCWDDDYGPLSVLTVEGKNTFTAEWLSALKEAGIDISQEARTTAVQQKIAGILAQPANTGLAQAVCPAEATPLAEVSHCLADVLPQMMKESNNIFAESVFYQLAARSGDKEAGRKQAATQIGTFLESIGLPSNYLIADGSGLSLYNYLSPTLLVRLLRHAWQQPFREVFLASLPVAGVDGTLKKRLLETPAAGKVRAKTGTVTGISSLAGFLTASNGHELCFAIINQGISSGATARAFQDKICLLLVSIGI